MTDMISITKVLLLFYLLTTNSLLQPLLSKQWKKMVENDRIIQHLIGFSTMVTLVILVNEGEVDYYSIVMYSLIAYLWFIFSTKMDIHFNIMIMIGLLGCYLYENNVKIKTNKIKEDKVLSDDQKFIMIDKQYTKQKYLMGGMMVAIIVGMFMYSQKKEVQYGGGYSLTHFLLY